MICVMRTAFQCDVHIANVIQQTAVKNNFKALVAELRIRAIAISEFQLFL